MKKTLKVAAIAVLTFVFGASHAQAEYFVWRDPATKLTVSYPDRWMVVNNYGLDDVLTVQAPGANAFAQCKIAIDDDQRFKIYPVHYSAALQRLNFSDEYWDHYLGQYDNVVLHELYDDAGMARGNASMVKVTYDTTDGALVQKNAIAFAALYRNKVYSVECSAEASSYARYHKSFLSFIKAIDFDKGTNFAITGYSRDFIQDPEIQLRDDTGRWVEYH